MKFVSCWRRVGIQNMTHFLCKKKIKPFTVEWPGLRIEPLAELVNKDMENLFNEGIADAYIDFTK